MNLNWKEIMADSLKNITTQVVKNIGQEIVAAAERVEQQRKATEQTNDSQAQDASIHQVTH